MATGRPSWLVVGIAVCGQGYGHVSSPKGHEEDAVILLLIGRRRAAGYDGSAQIMGRQGTDGGRGGGPTTCVGRRRLRGVAGGKGDGVQECHLCGGQFSR